MGGHPVTSWRRCANRNEEIVISSYFLELILPFLFEQQPSPQHQHQQLLSLIFIFQLHSYSCKHSTIIVFIMSCHNSRSTCTPAPCSYTTTSSSCSSRPVYTTTSTYPAYAARGQQASAAIRTNGPAFLRQNAIREGYLVKQGGIIKNWKRRFWILSGMALYYFVSPAVRSPLLPPSFSFFLIPS